MHAYWKVRIKREKDRRELETQRHLDSIVRYFSILRTVK